MVLTVPPSGLKTVVGCPAKINLHLQVVGVRPDGYHELRTIFQTIDLADELTLELIEGGGIDLSIPDSELSSGSENLVYRAAKKYLDHWGGPWGAKMLLKKRIPMGGGLGGGSSDAAATLRALGHLLGYPVPPEALWTMARELGADVPYFLVGGTALGVGRGDEVVPVADLPVREIGMVLNQREVSSAEVFRSLVVEDNEPLDPGWLHWIGSRENRWSDLPKMRNDLESSVFRSVPSLVAVHGALVEAGAETVRMSGSGSSVFALFPSVRRVPDAVSGLPDGCRYLKVRTVTR